MEHFLLIMRYWINLLTTKEIALLGAILGAITTLLAAYIAVKTAFRQISKQFEHKVIYEGWKDLQERLFDFSKALTNFDSTILWLTSFIDSQDNALVNGGNKQQYRYKKWEELTKLYGELQLAYIAFLKSFESHEVILLQLLKMRKEFIGEYRKRIEDPNQEFMSNLFPEMYRQTTIITADKAKHDINEYWYKMSEISAFLDDFRIELQNETAGKILNKKVAKRSPSDKKYKILTKNGLIEARVPPLEIVLNFFKKPYVRAHYTIIISLVVGALLLSSFSFTYATKRSESNTPLKSSKILPLINNQSKTRDSMSNYGSAAEWFGAIATTIAFLIAFFNEPLVRLIQGLKDSADIVEVSQIKQGNMLKSRLKVINSGTFSDTFRGYVISVKGKKDFIEVPLLWMHGFAEGENTSTVKKITKGGHGWLDFITVDLSYYGVNGIFMYLDLGAGTGSPTLQLLNEGRTELLLEVNPNLGRPTHYNINIEWDGTHNHPVIKYSKC